MSLEKVLFGLFTLTMATCVAGLTNSVTMHENWAAINNVLWKVYYIEVLGVVVLFMLAYWRDR